MSGSRKFPFQDLVEIGDAYCDLDPYEFVSSVDPRSVCSTSIPF